jgi:hypothetical protein
VTEEVAMRTVDDMFKPDAELTASTVPWPKIRPRPRIHCTHTARLTTLRRPRTVERCDRSRTHEGGGRDRAAMRPMGSGKRVDHSQEAARENVQLMSPQPAPHRKAAISAEIRNVPARSLFCAASSSRRPIACSRRATSTM